MNEKIFTWNLCCFYKFSTKSIILEKILLINFWSYRSYELPPQTLVIKTIFAYIIIFTTHPASMMFILTCFTYMCKKKQIIIINVLQQNKEAIIIIIKVKWKQKTISILQAIYWFYCCSLSVFAHIFFAVYKKIICVCLLCTKKKRPNGGATQGTFILTRFNSYHCHNTLINA